VGEYLTRFVPDVDERTHLLDTLAQVQQHPQIDGLGDWIEFSLAAKSDTNQALVRQNLLDDVGELQVALGIVRADPSAHVQIGNDAHAAYSGSLKKKLKSFDLIVTRGGQHTNVEVGRLDADELRKQDLGGAINHASEKIIDDPNVESRHHTTDPAEGALIVTWPQPPHTVAGKRTITVDRDGNVVMTMPNGHKVPQGNLFADYLDILNAKAGAKEKPPAGASKVRALTVYDRSGSVVQRFVKSEDGTWTCPTLVRREPTP
jgi:hypothetical protein